MTASPSRFDSEPAPSSSVRPAPRLLVVGCGGIGGVLSASLAERARDVTVLTTNASIFEAVDEHGIRLVDEGASRVVSTPVVLGPPKDGTFDYVLLATQPPQVEEAARSVVHLLAPDGAMVCLQNGLCEERLAVIAGEDRVLGAVVGWGATMPEPGLYERTAPGGFTVGTISGAPLDPRHLRLVTALEAVGSVDVTENLRGKRWSKLAINCAVSTLGTLGGDRLGPLLQHRFVRRLALEIMTEVVAVARAEGVSLEKVSGTLDLPWIALTEEERASSGSPGLVAKHGLLLAVGFRFRRMRSSMLSAIERGRKPAVDFLNGEVVDRARRHGIDAHVNALARDTVWALAEGKAQPGLALLREVYTRSRA